MQLTISCLLRCRSSFYCPSRALIITIYVSPVITKWMLIASYRVGIKVVAGQVLP
jgi:hypothetical protein